MIKLESVNWLINKELFVNEANQLGYELEDEINELWSLNNFKSVKFFEVVFQNKIEEIVQSAGLELSWWDCFEQSDNDKDIFGNILGLSSIEDIPLVEKQNLLILYYQRILNRVYAFVGQQLEIEDHIIDRLASDTASEWGGEAIHWEFNDKNELQILCIEHGDRFYTVLSYYDVFEFMNNIELRNNQEFAR